MFCGSKNVPYNMFLVQHMQSMFNAFILSIPLVIACFNQTPEIHVIEPIALCIWFFSLLMETVADCQLR